MEYKPQRKSPRLQGYDYSQSGGYFITICTYERKCIFGLIKDNQMMLSDVGHIADMCRENIPNHYRDVRLGDFVVMPNHIHGILYLTGNESTFKQYWGEF